MIYIAYYTGFTWPICHYAQKTTHLSRNSKYAPHQNFVSIFVLARGLPTSATLICICNFQDDGHISSCLVVYVYLLEGCNPTSKCAKNRRLGVTSVKIRVFYWNGPKCPTKVFLASTTYDKQLTVEKIGLSHQIWSRGGYTLKKRTLNSQNSRPAQTDPYASMPVWPYIHETVIKSCGRSYQMITLPRQTSNFKLIRNQKYVAGIHRILITYLARWKQFLVFLISTTISYLTGYNFYFV